MKPYSLVVSNLWKYDLTHSHHLCVSVIVIQARKLEEADLIRTGGVRYKETLLAVTADGEGDKILLPPSALDSLSRQDAVSMGPMLFELSVVTASPSAVREGGATNDAIVSRTTHAGVLEFVADEGTVGLPRKVVSSLLGTLAQKTSVPSDEGKMSPRQGDQPESGGSGVGDRSDANQDASSRPAVEGLGTVVVRYVRLAKATFARVVPETVGLSQVSELRAMLEHNMRNHATLSVGDRLTVWRRGKEFGMKVRLSKISRTHFACVSCHRRGDGRAVAECSST